jgi:outer membrane protein assembly factor BamB
VLEAGPLSRTNRRRRAGFVELDPDANQTGLMKHKSLWPIAPWCLLIPLAAAATTALAADADKYNRNWPQWRGPAGNGLVLHGNPPLEWSEQKNVKWKVAIPGRGHATPILWENRIFVLTAVPQQKAALMAPAPTIFGQAQEPPGERRRGGGGFGRGGGRPTEEYAFTVLCLDRQTGRTLWEKVARKEVPHQGIQPSNSYSSASPVTDGERLYVSFGSHGLYCYDLDGKLLWDKDLGKVNVTFGEGSSPALHGEVLIVLQDNNADSFVYAFDKHTGRELWKQPRDEGSGWTTPFFVQHGGKTQVVISGSRAVRGYDLQTGEELWRCAGLGSNPIPMPVADSATVYAMSGHRNPAALAIQPGGRGDLTGTDAVRWKLDRGTPYVPSPLLYDGLLFFCQRTDSIVTCVDPVTGQPHYEQARLAELGGVYASPIGVNNRIYLASQNGVTVVLEKSKELKVLASNKLDDGFDASPAVVGHELFLRGRQHLYCLAER